MTTTHRHQQRWRRVALVVALLFASVVAGIPLASHVSAASETVTLDEGTPLTKPATVQEFQDSGYVTVDVAQLDMQFSIAESAGDVGLSEWTHASSVNTYLRIQYDEEIERTVRFYVPSDYWTPRVKTGLNNAGVHQGSKDITIDLEPAAGGEYTAVTIRLTGPTDAVFGVGRATGALFDVRGWADGALNDTTGISLPSLPTSGGTEWQYVDEAALTGNNTTYSIHASTPDELTIQYDYDEQAGEENTRWLPVPACEDGDARGVCRFQKQGAPETVFLLSTSDAAPPIRYATDPDAVSTGGSIVDQLASVPGRIWEDVTGLWPGTLVAGGAP